MVVLSLLKKIQPICISKKLKLYLANLPKEDDNDWYSELAKEMMDSVAHSAIQSNRYRDDFENVNSLNIKSIFDKKYHNISSENMTDVECVQYIADEMIYLYFDYNAGDIPTGDWTTNCFDSRCCEKDYTEKIVSLIRFVCDEKTNKKYPKVPIINLHTVYSSDSYESTNNYGVIFSGTTDVEETIKRLVEFGVLLDNFLNNEEDYYFFDYLCNELFEFDKNDFTPNHCQKAYSLCEFFLENKYDQELDEKLPPFINEFYSLEDRKTIATIARQVRNKVAHGDFSKFREKIEEYAIKVMDSNGYWFDYSEYSRQNWAIMNLCYNLLDSIRNLTAALLTDKNTIINLKNKK